MLERFVVALQIVQLLGECIAEKHAPAVIDVGASELALQLSHMIAIVRLHSQFRAQLIVGIARPIESDSAIAGFFSLAQPPHAALAGCQVVPEAPIIRPQRGSASIQRVGTFVLPQEQRHVGQCVVRLGRSFLALQSLLDHALGIVTTPEIHQDRCEHSMRGQADLLPTQRRFSQRQRVREPARRHELVGLDIQRGLRGLHV